MLGWALVILILLALLALTSPRVAVRMKRVKTQDNEVLIVASRISSTPHLFMIDTGYAGPPVVSTSFLAVQDFESTNLQARYVDAQRKMRRAPSIDERSRAVERFLAGDCTSYTSGCTMKLMSIASVKEQQANMFLCNGMSLMHQNGNFRSLRPAEVLVSHELPNSIHILTCDYLVHMSPCLLCMKSEELFLRLGYVRLTKERLSFTVPHSAMYGGAFACDFVVAGITFRLIIDTGAPGPICLGRSASQRLAATRGQSQAALVQRDNRRVTQNGVNGESVCSDVVRATVAFAGHTFSDSQVFCNDKESHATDGYVGMAFLRMFDLLIMRTGVGFRLSGLPMTRIRGAPGRCSA